MSCEPTVHLSVLVSNHDEAAAELERQAREYFGSRPFRISDVNVYPKEETMDGRTLVFQAEAMAMLMPPNPIPGEIWRHRDGWTAEVRSVDGSPAPSVTLSRDESEAVRFLTVPLDVFPEWFERAESEERE